MTEYDAEADSDDGVACPTCDRTFDTENGAKIHHVQAHGESIADRVELVCEYCDDTYSRHPLNTDGSRCCSDDCYDAWRSKNKVGEDAPNWKGGDVTLTCDQCGGSYQRSRGQENRFCSRECYGAYRSEHYTGKQTGAWKGGDVTLVCAQCGEEYTKPQSRAGESRFCSNTCNWQWLSENQLGEDNPWWSGGALPYGEGWTEQKRESVRERQDRLCLGCGMDEAENGQRLSVHHITKARTLQDAPPEVQHGDDNLVALCIACHRQWEQMSPLRPQIADY